MKNDKDTIRLNFEFPKEEYPYLKMLCAMKGMSLKEFATAMLITALDEYENELLAKKANDGLKEIEQEEAISWDEACQLAGWQDDAQV